MRACPYPNLITREALTWAGVHSTYVHDKGEMLQGHSGERSSEGIGEGTGLGGHGMQRLARQQVGMSHGGGL